jgi:predicted nuclease with TOPRIM domain
MKNTLTINLDETKFQDEELRKIVEKLSSKFDTINERTKKLTKQIKELEKKK